MSIRIAAFYIPSGYIPHIFGKDHGGITINLGGESIYKFRDNEPIEVQPNPFFIDDILSKDIALFSCIVGVNGCGKSTLLGNFSNAHHFKYVIEYEDRFEITDDIESFHRIYYTPHLNYKTFDAPRDNFKDLSKYALVNLDNHGDSGLLIDFLKEHESQNMRRWIKFIQYFRGLNKKEIIIPTFETVLVEFEHFEVDIYSQNFHNTPDQLRHPIRLILEKIKSEEQARSKEIFASKAAELLSGSKRDRLDFSIKFEYEFYELILGKFVSILEKAGNHYLEEGFISDDYDNVINSSTVREAIIWLFENSGVRSGKERYAFSDNLPSLLELMNYIISVIDEGKFTDSWRKIALTNNETLEIINRYDDFNNSFINDWFSYDVKPMFSFVTDIIISSGEQSFLNLFGTIYNHFENITEGIDIDYHSTNSLSKIGKNVVLLLDEGDSSFHPQWKKEYVKLIRDVIPLIFKGYNIQIILSTHDPLTLSDFPKNNVVFIERVNGISGIANSNTKKTFGANISDLLKDSFFIQDGQIGNFTIDFINKIISGISSSKITQQEIEDYKRIISCLDEPILKFKLAEMLSEYEGDRNFQKLMLDEEIEKLTERRKTL